MIRIITDSAADIELQEAQTLQITILPMQIQFGEQSFLDRYEITADAFYQKLIETDALPSTSQINPYTFEEEFEKVKAAGDSAIVILVGAELSGTYQNAHLVAADYDNIYVVDSRNVTVGEQCLVRLAVLLRDKGKNAAEIADILNEKKEKVTILALLDTLEYLKKGGRISAAAAAVGNLLVIKPVITVRDGKIAVVGKARGSKSGNNLLMEQIRNGGIDYSLPLILGYSGLDHSLLDKYIEDSRCIWDGHTDQLYISQMGSTIGTHAGPGAIAVGFFRP
ncbi:MAG: DegV family protein [Butyrivibrio sp.]|jgi:DegV family protein with EDD domain|nr:DegV family protein [Butyrivibrio sp.]